MMKKIHHRIITNDPSISFEFLENCNKQKISLVRALLNMKINSFLE